MNQITQQIQHIARVPVTERPAWRYLTVCLAFIAMLLVPTSRAWGQDNATINGTVVDASGALVPNAAISLTNPATGQARQVTSNSAGAYRFANVGVGTYTLSTSVSGFQKYTKTGIVVNVAATLEEDVTLTVGSQQQTVTVEADALQVQSESSEVSTLISGQQVSQLSTNGRNVTSLAALGLGVSNNLPQFGGVNALTASSGISFNGARTAHNIYMLDGGEQNDRGCGGCFMNLPSQDAIAEFQTLDSNYQPDYGVGSGGTILMVLKSGTHDFHGEVYEFNRNTAYNAKDYFSKTTPEFKLNEPGGNIGGPLWIPHVYNNNRNRTFFFYNEEWRRLIQGSSPSVMNTILDSNFPTSGQDLHYTEPSSSIVPVYPTTYNVDPSLQGTPFPKNEDGTYTIPWSLIDKNATLQLNSGTFPHPNHNNGTQYIASIPAPTYVREEVIRIDHAINSKYQLMGHYLHDSVSPSFFPPLWDTTNVYPTVGTAMTNPSYSVAIKLTQTYSPSLLNETAFLYSGNKITLTPITSGAGSTYKLPSGWTASSFFPVADNAGQDMPEVDLQGSPLNTTWTESYFPWKNGYEGFDYRDDVSWTRGRHQFKFGASWLHDYKNQQLQANTQGTAVFNSNDFSKDSYINYLLGDATSFTQLQSLYGKHWVNNNYSGYANDNWHITPRLTLNLGVRFDGMPHAFERYNLFANFIPADYTTPSVNPVQADGTLLPSALSTYPGTGYWSGEQFYLNGIREANVNGFPRGVVSNEYKTWQPRIGFALDIFGNGKSILRGGFGTFYERIQGNDVYNAALNPPFAYQPSATNVEFSNPNISVLTGSQPTTTQLFPSTMTSIKYHYPNPGTANFSLGIQHQLAPSIIAQVQYVGSSGWNQNADRNINSLPLTNSDPDCPVNPTSLYCDRQGVAGKIPDPDNPDKYLTPLNTNHYRIYPGYSTITQEENGTNTTYNSFQAGLRLENRHGVSATFAYTWSHEIDIVYEDLNIIDNPFDTKYDRGSGFLDRRHIFNASYIYNLPFFAKSTNLAAHEILGGWSISGVTTAQRGVPQYPNYNGPDTLGLGSLDGGNNRPNLLSKVTYPKKAGQWFSTNSFGAPTAPWDNGGATQGWGNAGKDAIVGPGLFNWNLSLFKSIPLTSGEGPRFELRFESYNTFNHPQFSGFDSSFADSNYGAVTSVYGMRNLELGGKFVF